jgi:hypothetical protein
MKKLAAIAALAVTTTILTAPSASAQRDYPWCVITGGRSAGTMSCGFVSFQQCMATRLGTDMCVRNPRWEDANSTRPHR